MSKHCTWGFLFIVAAASVPFGGCSQNRPDFPSPSETLPGSEDAGNGSASGSDDSSGVDSGATSDSNGGGAGSTSTASTQSTDTSAASLSLGAVCNLDTECVSGFCVDGVCCMTSCEEICAHCNAPGLAGICSVEAGVSCQDGSGTCSASGQCVVAEKLSLGEPCGANDECISAACVAAVDGEMRCCENSCDGLCEACSETGECDQAPTDDTTCGVVTCPPDTPCRTYPSELTADRCASVGVCETEESHCLPNFEPSGTDCGSGLACDGDGECVSVCTESEKWCTDECVDTDSDADNCGECGDECGTGLVCSDGECVANCSAQQVTCGNSCVDPLTNSNNCGASGDCMGENAGSKCTAPASCVNGECQVVCSNGQINCDGNCINPNTSATFCGASAECTGENRGAPCATANGYACEEGVCRLQCAANLIACDGTCINPTNNEEFCGAADYCEDTDRGVECGSTKECINGVCKLIDGQECNTNSDCRANNCTQFFYDDDGDGFHSADVDSMKLCGTVPPSEEWSTEDLDCCDTNADVNPDYAGEPMEVSAPGCGNSFFDYNCDGELTPSVSLAGCSSFSASDCPGVAGFGSDTMTGPSPWCGEDGGVSACAVVDGACAAVRGAGWTMACY